MSESRNNNESRYSYSSNNSLKERRGDERGQVNNIIYNNLEDIDSLIEKLERETPVNDSNNFRIECALDKRRQKINELKKLRDEIKKQREEEKKLKMLEQSNDELDDVIVNVKKMVKTSTITKNNPTYSSYSSYDFDYSSESHDSGESRW